MAKPSMARRLEPRFRQAGSTSTSRSSKTDDWDLLVAGMSLWVASVARVGLALAQHEAFGAEATPALACVVGLTWLRLRSPGSENPR